MVSVFSPFPKIGMVSMFPCFPYMVVLPRHLNVKAIVQDMALPQAAMDTTLSQGPLLVCHNDMAAVVSWNTPDLSGSPAMAMTGCQLIICNVSKRFVAYFCKMTPYT